MTWEDSREKKPWESDGEGESWLPQPPSFGSDDDRYAPWKPAPEVPPAPPKKFMTLDDAIRALDEALSGLMRDTYDLTFQQALNNSLPNKITFSWHSRAIDCHRIENCVYLVRCPACGRHLRLDLSGANGAHAFFGTPDVPTIKPLLACPWRYASPLEGPVCTWRVRVHNGYAFDILLEDGGHA